MSKWWWETLRKDFSKAAPPYQGIDEKHSQAPLPKEVETVVVEGGQLGLNTALELAEKGRSVLVLEKGAIAGSSSARSGGQMWPGFEASLSEMTEPGNKIGDNLAKSVWGLVHETMRKIHTRISTREDKCDFHPGVLLLAKTTPQAEWIQEEAAAYKKAGFGYASYLEQSQIKNEFINTDFYLNGILFRGEEGEQYGHLNPLKYTETVAKLAQDKGAQIREQSPVQRIRVLEEGGYIVSTPEGDVKAKNIVMATGVDFLRPKGVDFNLVPRTNVPVSTVILTTGPIPEKLAREMMPGDAAFADASDVAMNYGRMIPDPENPGHYRLTFGGADGLFKLHTAWEVRSMEKEMRRIFPQLEREGIAIEKMWSGQIDLSRDRMPMLLNPRDGFYHASGFSGHGMVNTALYATAIAEKMLGDGAKFETLQQLNPEAFSNSKLKAIFEAATIVLPDAVREIKEQSAEDKIRSSSDAKYDPVLNPAPSLNTKPQF